MSNIILREHIIKWEGIRNHAYKDVAGLLTIGIGHLLTRSELSSGKIRLEETGQIVRWREGLTNHQVFQLHEQDIAKAEAEVRSFMTTYQVPLSQHQFDALVSFTFNVGTTAFRQSTLARFLKRKLYNETPNQLRRWRYAGGKVVQGLINRREAEVKLWEGDRDYVAELYLNATTI